MSAITPVQDDARLMEQVLLKGDLKDLSPAQRVSYYQRVCASLGLNPLTKPFDYLWLSKKTDDGYVKQLVLYAKRDATDQLRRLHTISVVIAGRDRADDLYIVSARATTSDGRADESIGAVPIAGLKGDLLANAMMKAETKAKRRVTLSIAGLGWLDESEVPSVSDAQVAQVDTETGEITEATVQETTPLESRKNAIGRLNKAFVGSGLGKDDLRDKAREIFARPTIAGVADLSDQEVSALADEVEGLIAATTGAS